MFSNKFRLTIAIVACGGCWLLASRMAAGQSGAYEEAMAASTGPTYAAATARPTVSPYLNLDYGPNGLSNYQTLVRPLIEEREAINRQSARLDRLNRQLHGAAAAGNWREVERISNAARSQGGGRFMHYSHYFGTVR